MGNGADDRKHLPFSFRLKGYDRGTLMCESWHAPSANTLPKYASPSGRYSSHTRQMLGRCSTASEVGTLVCCQVGAFR